MEEASLIMRIRFPVVPVPMALSGPWGSAASGHAGSRVNLGMPRGPYV